MTYLRNRINRLERLTGVVALSVLFLLPPAPGVASELMQTSDATARSGHFFRPDLRSPRPKAPPARIVSLAPVVTETLFALGVGSSVVGVTRFCDRPAEAKSRIQVGGFVDPQLEAIVGLRPDLVIAMPSMGQRNVLEALRAQGVPVLVVFGDTIREIRDLIESIGEATFQSARARQKVAALDRSLQDIRQRFQQDAKPLQAIVVIQVSPLVIAGPNTFADEALRWVGASPAVPRNAPAWPTWSLEALLFLRPDVVIAAEGEDSARRLRLMLAGQKGPRVVAAERTILMRPGPHLAEDVEMLAAILHTPKAP